MLSPQPTTIIDAALTAAADHTAALANPAHSGGTDSLAQIDPTSTPNATGCSDCERGGGWWLHLRRCAACGNIACCDTSPSRHARSHARGTGHRVMRSFEPGESWFYDFGSGRTFTGPVLSDPQHRPLNQSGPGPADRVPSDWRQHLRDLVLISAHRSS